MSKINSGKKRKNNFDLALFLKPFLFFLVFLFCTRLHSQNIYLVDSSKVNNQTAVALTTVTVSDWNSACRDLQVALDSAKAGDQIWVKYGTYRPTKDKDDSIPSP